MKIDVLDHGFVRLVSYMQPVPVEVDTPVGEALAQPFNWTGDLEIVRNARVSYDSDWRGKNASVHPEQQNKDKKLINYMMEHNHSSPFEAMVFTFEVKAPIFVFRQWHRHRTWSYNEVSARYAKLPDEYYTPEAGVIGKQSLDNKQARDLEADYDRETAENCSLAIASDCSEAFQKYEWLLGKGVPRELARGVLTLNTYSRMFATVDLHNLFHFLKLRLDSHAQYEIRVYAQAIVNLIEPICPEAVEAFRRKSISP